MARKRKSTSTSAYVLFDVVYADGTLTSNRKVPGADLGGLDGDEPALTFIETQDREIGEKSGKQRGKIKTIARSKKK